ncbi:hypothetical protein FF1_016225 [Malus domestica]
MKERMLKVALRPQVGQAYLKKVTEFVMTESKNREAEVVLEGLLDAMDWYSDNQQETVRSALHVAIIQGFTSLAEARVGESGGGAERKTNLKAQRSDISFNNLDD